MQSDLCPYKKRKFWDTNRHQGCVHGAKTTWRHSEKALMYKPRREVSREQTLSTPWTWTSSLQKFLLLLPPQSAVFCCGALSRLIHFVTKFPSVSFLTVWRSLTLTSDLQPYTFKNVYSFFFNKNPDKQCVTVPLIPTSGFMFHLGHLSSFICDCDGIEAFQKKKA